MLITPGSEVGWVWLGVWLTTAGQDSTLITTASGKKHGNEASDWKWWHSQVPVKLRELFHDGCDTLRLHRW
jgi:hypothetical protein